MPRPAAGPRCPCHSRKRLRRCCGPLLAGRAAATPTALMRSRFAAYALGRTDYILATTDPTGPRSRDDTARWEADVARFSATTRFRGLQILSASPADADRATVTFRATLEQGGADASFAERSTFVRGPDGRWRYASGERLEG